MSQNAKGRIVAPAAGAVVEDVQVPPGDGDLALFQRDRVVPELPVPGRVDEVDQDVVLVAGEDGLPHQVVLVRRVGVAHEHADVGGAVELPCVVGVLPRRGRGDLHADAAVGQRAHSGRERGAAAGEHGPVHQRLLVPQPGDDQPRIGRGVGGVDVGVVVLPAVEGELQHLADDDLPGEPPALVWSVRVGLEVVQRARVDLTPERHGGADPPHPQMMPGLGIEGVAVPDRDGPHRLPGRDEQNRRVRGDAGTHGRGVSSQVSRTGSGHVAAATTLPACRGARGQATHAR